MATKTGEKILTVIRAVARRLHDDGAAAADLLAQYRRDGDETAFGQLVRRHGGMVLGVARRILGHEQDAEDVCQATFLLLARKAPRGLRQQSIAGWLCVTSRLIALNARKARTRRAGAEARAKARISPSILPSPLESMTAAELVGALDEEMARLPDRYRGPLVLCCLEGLARDVAARRLGIPLGTLRIQLERARERLRLGLRQRGIELGAALVAALAVSEIGQARAQVVEAGLNMVTGTVSPAVATLVKGVPTMTRMKLGVGLVLPGTLTIASGMGAARKFAPSAQAAADNDQRVVSQVTHRSAKTPANKQGFLQSRITAADTGKPLAGARIRVLTEGIPGKKSFAEAISNAEGRYSVKLPLGDCYLFGVFAPPGYYTHDAKTFGHVLTTTAEPRIVRDFVMQPASCRSTRCSSVAKREVMLRFTSRSRAERRGFSESFANRLATTEVPAAAYLAVTITYPAKAGQSPPRRKFLLKQRC